MTTPASPDDNVSSALLSFLSSTTYPASEVASVELTSKTVVTTLSGLESLLREAESSIRDLSEASKTEIDPWISQARSLSQSVEASKAEAAAIVEDHHIQQSRDATVRDAQAKVTLLSREVDFIASLTGALDGLAICVGLVDSAANLLADGDVSGALEKVGDAEAALRGVSDAARVKGVLERRVRNVREEGVGVVRGLWSGMVHVFEDGRGLVVKKNVKGSEMSIDDVVNVMSKMGILSAAVSRLHRDLDTVVVSPRAIPSADGNVPRVEVSKDTIKLSGRSDEESDVEELIDDIYKIVNFIKQSLPQEVSEQMLDKILPSLTLQLVSRWLDPSMPLELDHLERFENITSMVATLEEFLKATNVNIPSEADLNNWLGRMPQNWLARRKESALADLRTNCYAAVRVKEFAERVETQVVSSDDVMYGEVEGQAEHPTNQAETEDAQQQEDWDSGWNEDEQDRENKNGKPSDSTVHDEDSSAWDFEDSESKEEPSNVEEGQEDDADADAWGWGDDNEETETPASLVEPKPTKPVLQIGKTSKQASTVPAAPKTITLREKYTITHIPSTIISLISSVLDDAITLSSPDFPIHEIASAVPGLSTIPTLILAMYRATANTYYVNEAASNMVIYNDATNLSSSLQSLLSSIAADHPLKNLRNRLEPDLSTLNSFARRAYGREMAAQRTVLSDILSSASGFVNATLPLNTRQYRATVEDAISHVRSLNLTWTNVLSDSARLQSLGGLVGELCRGITSDILERADDPQGISEEQSKVLKGFVDQVATLQDLFYTPESLQQPEEERRSLVHVYAPGWLRFIYLGEILEASLADIRYLWTEGELHLEFEAGEVIDLIQALFADSSHRRDAIRAIKRTSVNRG